MDRALSANVITKSGKAVETAGDIDTLLLDKTGTITIGNRKATQSSIRYPALTNTLLYKLVYCPLFLTIPEGKSIVELGREKKVYVYMI